MFLFTIILIIGGLAFYVHQQSDQFSLSRSMTMNAPASDIFPHVNELRQWNAWSPWAKMDPDARTVFSGEESGVNSQMSWISANNQVGTGSMTIIESRPNELVRLRLDFKKPMTATNTGEFSFKQTGNQTLVTWSMSGDKNFIAKAMHLVFNCDKLVGDKFEEGLLAIKTIVESRA